MESLNYDVVNNIFAQLNLIDLINCQAVCPLFAEVAIDHYRRRFKSFVLDTDGERDSLNTRRTFTHIGSYIECLQISTSRIPFRNVQNVIDRCPNLVSLQLDNMCKVEAKGAVVLNNLRELIVENGYVGDTFIGCLLKGSPNLEKLSFSYIPVSGKCLAQAPMSIRTLEIVDTYSMNMNAVFDYLKRNPNILRFELVKDEDTHVDLNVLCVNLRKVKRLNLLCDRVEHFQALAQLPDLTSLSMIIRCKMFHHYPISIVKNSQHLLELGLDFIDIAVSPSMAKCLEVFRRLTILKLNFKRSPNSFKHMAPYLGPLPALQSVTLLGDPCDLTSVALHLTQIKHLRINVGIDHMHRLAYLQNLRDLQMFIDVRCTRAINGVATSVNQFMRALARSNSLQSLTLQVSRPVKLSDETALELLSFDLHHIILYGGFIGDDALKIARNLMRLHTFTQYHGGMDWRTDAMALRLIRPETLKVEVHNDETICIH